GAVVAGAAELERGRAGGVAAGDARRRARRQIGHAAGAQIRRTAAAAAAISAAARLARAAHGHHHRDDEHGATHDPSLSPRGAARASDDLVEHEADGEDHGDEDQRDADVALLDLLPLVDVLRHPVEDLDRQPHREGEADRGHDGPGEAASHLQERERELVSHDPPLSLHFWRIGYSIVRGAALWRGRRMPPIAVARHDRSGVPLSAASLTSIFSARPAPVHWNVTTTPRKARLRAASARAHAASGAKFDESTDTASLSSGSGAIESPAGAWPLASASSNESCCCPFFTSATTPKRAATR